LKEDYTINKISHLWLYFPDHHRKHFPVALALALALAVLLATARFGLSLVRDLAARLWSRFNVIVVVLQQICSHWIVVNAAVAVGVVICHSCCRPKWRFVDCR